MASCRLGRIPLVDDPINHITYFADLGYTAKVAGLGVAATTYMFYYKLQKGHRYIQWKGPDNPFMRIRHKRYPSGAMAFGWGNNGLNRDCGVKEFECWAGYIGKEYTY